jgi:hypothetical protein
VSILDSSLLSLIIVAVVATGGIFLAVVLGGLLSGLMTLGALELHFRARIQEVALKKYFRLSQFKAEPEPAAQSAQGKPQSASLALADFLRGKYDKSLHDRIGDYSKQLMDLAQKEDLVPTLAQMDSESLYRLHYRQICGQFATVVSNEVMQQEQGKHLSGFTPLTDVLVFLSLRRNPILSILQREPAPPGAAGVVPRPPVEKRADLDLALREIDGIQATLGSSLSKETFPYVLVAWCILYALALIGTAISLPFFTYSGSWFAASWTLVLHLLTIFAAAVTGIVLALGSAVFGALTFTWFDRFLASK